jgi:hypothetical protein
MSTKETVEQMKTFFDSYISAIQYQGMSLGHPVNKITKEYITDLRERTTTFLNNVAFLGKDVPEEEGFESDTDIN